MQQIKTPILIVGFERSGTTLLRRLVSMCPDLKYNLIHEKWRLFDYLTAKEAEEQYFFYSKQGGKNIGGIDSIQAGEKIAYRANVKETIQYIERFTELWPKGTIIHIVRNSKDCAKSAKNTFQRDYKKTIAIWNYSVPQVSKYTHIDLRYCDIVDAPKEFITELYAAMGCMDAPIDKIISAKNPWQHGEKVMCGLRYYDCIRRQH